MAGIGFQLRKLARHDHLAGIKPPLKTAIFHSFFAQSFDLRHVSIELTQFGGLAATASPPPQNSFSGTARVAALSEPEQALFLEG